MKLLLQLDEAANIPLDQLKAKMQKDPRVKMIFQRSLSVDELKDPVEFAKTIHYYVFNNPQVRAYMEKRGDRRDISKGWAKSLAKSTAPVNPLKQTDLDWLQALIKELFKDVGYVQKKDISKRASEALHAFLFNKRATIDAYSVREIDSLDIKPDGPLTLYKGLIFNERSLRAEDHFGYGEGLKFLKAVREGSRTVDLDPEDCTLWTKSRKDAILSALYGDDAKFKRNEETPSKIEKHKGLLAFVISTRADPADVLIDLAKNGETHGWPTDKDPEHGWVILKPGKRLARVVSRYTQDGEEDPLKGSQEKTDLDVIQAQLELLSKVIKLPFPTIRYLDMSRDTYNPEVMQQVAILLDEDNQQKIVKLFNTVQAFYRKHLAGLDLNKLSDQQARNPGTYAALREIADLFDNYIYHKDFADPNASRLADRQRGSAKLKDLTSGEQLLTAYGTDSYAKNMAQIVANQKRFTDWGSSGLWKGFAKISDPNITFPDKLHLAGWKQQKPIVDAAVDGFYQVVGRPKPADVKEQAAEMYRDLSMAAKVATGARFLQGIKEAAAKAAA